jgi:hypothetical protein
LVQGKAALYFGGCRPGELAQLSKRNAASA